MTRRQRWALAGSTGLLAVLVGTLVLAPPMLDRKFNQVLDVPLPAVSEAAKTLHARLDVVDLHADPLLWKRDLLRQNDRGHVDVPRLIEGNVALQVFGAVTKSPRGQNYQRNAADSDRITDLVIVQAWPPATWTSLLARALYQAGKLHRFASDSEGRLRVIHNRAELDGYLALRPAAGGITAGLLGIEGMHAIEGELDNIDRLYEAGYRMMGITHFFDNELGGSAHGLAQDGLTGLGREALARMQALGVVVDLAHASPKVVSDVLQLASSPVVVSHGGVQGTCPGPRNLSDPQLRALARNGGVIGIGYWDAAICEATPTGFVRAVQHVVSVAGIDHAALGSDFDGGVATAFDTSRLNLLTDALMRAGFAPAQIRLIMGDNALRVVRANLH